MNYLPKLATIAETCEWLAAETGEQWTLPRLLETALQPWVWLDYSPEHPEFFGNRHEGFLARFCFMGDTFRLEADRQSALMTMTETCDGRLWQIPAGVRIALDELRFKREDVTQLAADLRAPAPVAPTEQAANRPDYDAELFTDDPEELREARAKARKLAELPAEQWRAFSDDMAERDRLASLRLEQSMAAARQAEERRRIELAEEDERARLRVREEFEQARQRGAIAKQQKPRGRKPTDAPALLAQILDALESYADATGQDFDRRAMPGPLGKSADDEGGFHWLCARLYPRAFNRAPDTFTGYRAGLCALAPYPKPTDFYRLALPRIAPKLGVTLDVRHMPKKGREIA